MYLFPAGGMLPPEELRALMHLIGLRGMPRRVFTYQAGLGFDVLNLVSTVGAFILAAGVAVVVWGLIRPKKRQPYSERNPWNAGTLEWLQEMPGKPWGIRSIPEIDSRYPLWDQPNFQRDVDEGRFYLPDAWTRRFLAWHRRRTAAGRVGLTLLARRWNKRDRRMAFYAGLLIAAALAVAGGGALIAGPWFTGLDPKSHVYAATVWLLAIWTAFHVAVGLIMQLYCVARRMAGRMSARYDIDINNVALYWHFTALTAVTTSSPTRTRKSFPARPTMRACPLSNLGFTDGPNTLGLD